MISSSLGSGFTLATPDSGPDPTLPVVLLLHGLGGSELDMTDPLTARGSVAYDRTATFPLYQDAGFALTPPGLPVNGFFLDPLLSSLTSWRTALVGAGFSTISYTQTGGVIAGDVAQLTAFAAGPLSMMSELARMRVAILGHSRGGLVARAFLVAVAATPALAPLLSRVTTVITLHSPHRGSGVANLAGTVDALLVQATAVLGGMGIPPPAVLTMVRATTANPAVAELGIGSPVLAAIAAAEPVPGVAYHTFGGTSTQFARLWANVFTPDSAVPLPVPFPLFHWGTTPWLVGIPLDARSFVPSVVFAPLPVVTEMVAVTTALGATTPELAYGSGDGLVADARAHLPTSATRRTNALNHAEALWHPELQSQVLAILRRLRTPATVRPAHASITPFPASLKPALHTVTAADALTGRPLSGGTVTVRDTFGKVALTTGLGAAFRYGFAPRKVVVTGGNGPLHEVEHFYPSVTVNLPAPHGDTAVDLGSI